MKLKLILISLLIPLAHVYSQNLNWVPQPTFEAGKGRFTGFLGVPIKDTVGGVGFGNRDSVGSLIYHPVSKTLYVKGDFGYFGLARKTGEGGYLQNQSSVYQSASFKINGTAEVNNSAGINGSLKVNNLVSEIGIYNSGTALFRLQTYWDGISTGGIKVFDFLSKGMVYENNYAAAGVLDDRWIPDYGAVKSYVSAHAGTGTVSSVDLSLPSIFSVTNSPVTTSGVLTGTFVSQTANTIFAAPDGTSGTPSFRSLLSTDIPSLAATYIQNQSSVDQVGSLRINGTARIGGFVNLGSTAIPTSPLTITYTSGNQLTLVNGSGSEVTSVGNTGIVTRTASGSAAQFLFMNATEVIGGLTSSGTSISQMLLRYDATHYESSTVSSTGSITRDLIGSSPTFSFGKAVSVTGSLSTTGRMTSTLTTEQLRLAYDASNYLSTTVASNGSTTFDLTGTSPLFSFGKGTSFTAGLAANNVGFNLSVVSINGATSVTTAQYLFGGASTVNYRVGVRGSSTNTLAAASSGGSFVVGKNDFTTASSGAHAVIGNAIIMAPTITSGGASTITNAASLYVDAAPTGASNNWAFYVAAGESRFLGPVSTPGGFWTSTNASGTTAYTNSNFGAFGGMQAASSGLSSIIFGGASSIYGRAFVNGTTTTTMASTSSAANLVVGQNALTTAATGTHAVIANAAILAPTITSGGATVTNATSLYIDAAPTGGTTNSAFLINAGDARLQNLYATAPTYSSGSYQQVVRNTTSGRFETINSSSNVVDITGTTQTASGNVEYFSNNASLVTITLPTASVQGDKVYVRGKGAGGWKVSQSTGQTIHGTSNTTTGTSGFVASQNRYDVVTLEALDSTGNEWLIIYSMGTLTIN